ncbi:class GN sortase [Thiolapillus sp.]
MRKALLAGLLLVSTLAFGQGVWIHAKALLAQYLIADAWQQRLQGEEKAKPWSWADTWPVARLEAPALGIRQYVLAGATGRTLAFGPGQVPGSAIPGYEGNSVISGHRDTHFRWLRGLKKGDELRLQRPDGRLRRYRVQGTAVVDEKDTRILRQDGRTVLHLVTCYPFDALVPGGPLRYVVTAAPVAGEQVF